MSEEFIKQFQKLPESNFVEKVHGRLERKARIQAVKRYSILSAFALIFVLGMSMTFSSTVRAYVLQTLEEIAGIPFTITNNYPGHPGEKEITVPSKSLSLEEAQVRFPSPIALPAYVPQGYERRGDVSLTTFADPDMPLLTTIFLDVTWETQNGNVFVLSIRHCSSGLENCRWVVGEGALEEITLNGRPAVVLRGGWNYDTRQYDFSFPAAIEWKYDEKTIYSLTGSQGISLDELIRIAESIP
jgi:hypothetical protein